ncbi:hypothetical protein IEQ34_004548 [Dendrobium chrysotoxum]|uniref:BHLH domain-containing protein n=1 Tax=Dendrobium chrysotoxum TaxID=161865 RepID=A0AAV7GZS9_DENCH|nr:hypothetical protein IEQ34_004548 [Dendrobium chrysotoxum]
MESFGVVPEICWNSFEEQIQYDQETNAMAQLLEGQIFGYDQVREQQSSGLMSMLWPYNEASAYCYLSDPNANYEGINYHAMEDEQLAASFFQIDAGNPFEGFISPNEVNSDESTECNAANELELQNWRMIQADECNADVVPAERLQKKTRVQKATKNSRSKKKQKGSRGGSDEEESNAGINVQSTSSYSSEEDYLNASQDVTEGGSVSSCSKGPSALNLNGKVRAGRGAATDPQSLYARKRRERINERLRILQNLVPNGTKVDISTMLDEAVQYVKFLQLQIKLLSSDELWMYAPLAYNGMNIGLDLMIPTNKL